MVDWIYICKTHRYGRDHICYYFLSTVLHTQCLAFHMHNHIWSTKQSREIKLLCHLKRLSGLAVVSHSLLAVEWGLHPGGLEPSAYLYCLLSSVVSLLRQNQHHRSCKQLDHTNYSLLSNNYSQWFADSNLQIYLPPKIYFNPWINTGSTSSVIIGHGHSRGQKIWTAGGACSQPRWNKEKLCLLVSALLLTSSVLPIVYLVPCFTFLWTVSI